MEHHSIPVPDTTTETRSGVDVLFKLFQGIGSGAATEDIQAAMSGQG